MSVAASILLDPYPGLRVRLIPRGLSGDSSVLFYSHEDRGHNPLPNASGTSGLAGAVSNKSMSFRHMWQI